VGALPTQALPGQSAPEPDQALYRTVEISDVDLHLPRLHLSKGWGALVDKAFRSIAHASYQVMHLAVVHGATV